MGGSRQTRRQRRVTQGDLLLVLLLLFWRAGPMSGEYRSRPPVLMTDCEVSTAPCLSYRSGANTLRSYGPDSMMIELNRSDIMWYRQPRICHSDNAGTSRRAPNLQGIACSERGKCFPEPEDVASVTSSSPRVRTCFVVHEMPCATGIHSCEESLKQLNRCLHFPDWEVDRFQFA